MQRTVRIMDMFAMIDARQIPKYERCCKTNMFFSAHGSLTACYTAQHLRKQSIQVDTVYQLQITLQLCGHGCLRNVHNGLDRQAKRVCERERAGQAHVLKGRWKKSLKLGRCRVGVTLKSAGEGEGAGGN